MWNFFDIDPVRVNKMIAEFKANFDAYGEVNFECIYRARDPSKNRQVFRLQIGSHMFAMKVDGTSDKTGVLKREFQTLKTLHAYFSKAEQLAVPEPFYLSPSGTFSVMSFSEGRTATQAISGNIDRRSVGQVYRRAGLFLHELHQFTELTEGKFYPNWMFETIDAAITRDPHAKAEQYEPLRKILHAQSKKLGRRIGAKGFCHGDFHASNLILGRGVTHGLDFTEVSRKLVVYDIVDILKSDIYREDVLGDVDQSGVSRQCKDMFFKRYRHPVDMDILDFCMRGRLLIDWLRITAERHNKSTFQKNKFKQLERRLNIAFKHQAPT